MSTETVRTELNAANIKLADYAQALDDDNEQEVCLLKLFKQIGKQTLGQITGTSSRPSGKSSALPVVQKLAAKNMMVQETVRELARTQQMLGEQGAAITRLEQELAASGADLRAETEARTEAARKKILLEEAARKNTERLVEKGQEIARLELDLAALRRDLRAETEAHKEAARKNALLEEAQVVMKRKVAGAMEDVRALCAEMSVEIARRQQRMGDREILREAQEARQQAESEARRIQEELDALARRLRCDSQALEQEVRKCQEYVDTMQSESLALQDRMERGALKVEHGGHIRLISGHEGDSLRGNEGDALCTFEELTSKAAKSFGLAKSAAITLTYGDPDGDAITVSSDEELAEVFRRFSARHHMIKLQLNCNSPAQRKVPRLRRSGSAPTASPGRLLIPRAPTPAVGGSPPTIGGRRERGGALFAREN